MFGDRNSKLSVDFRGDRGEDDIGAARLGGVWWPRHGADAVRAGIMSLLGRLCCFHVHGCLWRGVLIGVHVVIVSLMLATTPVPRSRS
jgi:hypothetical protein